MPSNERSPFGPPKEEKLIAPAVPGPSWVVWGLPSLIAAAAVLVVSIGLLRLTPDHDAVFAGLLMYGVGSMYAVAACRRTEQLLRIYLLCAFGAIGALGVAHFVYTINLQVTGAAPTFEGAGLEYLWRDLMFCLLLPLPAGLLLRRLLLRIEGPEAIGDWGGTDDS